MYDNVNLWFAKDINNKIVIIDEVNLESKYHFYCPMCGSDLIPKAVQSKLITPHFAHVDASKCNGEGMIHFWFKNKFLEPGDIFIVESDQERQYICKEVLVEQSYDLGDKTYRPDVTVLTECNNIIYFEMDYSNKKKVQDYIDIWLELRNIVVEVDIKKLMSKDKIPVFKALFYNGKCFNTKKNDTYYNTIGKYKESIIGNIDKIDDELKLRIQKLDWFWNDVLKYKKNEVDIEYMIDLIDSINDDDDREIVIELLNKPRCNNLCDNYIDYKINTAYKKIYNYIQINKLDDLISVDKRIVDKNYDSYKEGYIDLQDKNYVLKKSTYHFDIFDYSIDDIMIDLKRIGEKVIICNNYKNIINLYNANSQLITNKIRENQVFNNFIQYLTKEKSNYYIDFKVHKYYCSPYDFDSTNNINEYPVQFLLKYYNNGSKDTDEFNITVDLNTDISYTCEQMIEKFKLYFINLHPFQYKDEFNKWIFSLNDIYFDYKVELDYEDTWFEDIYKIDVNMDINGRHNYYLESYYISNQGILSHWGIGTTSRGKELLLKTNNIDEIKKYIINDLNTKIKEQTKRLCFDCEKEFTLELGEMKFFNSKGFKYPHRCKTCRDKRRNSIEN